MLKVESIVLIQQMLDKIVNTVNLVKSKFAKDQLDEALATATNDDNWQTSTQVMHSIAEAAYNTEKASRIHAFIQDKLKDNSKHWKQLLKVVVMISQTLNIVQFLLRNGPEHSIGFFRQQVYHFRQLESYSLMESGVDRGQSIREKAKEIVSLLGNHQHLEEERIKAKKIRQRMGTIYATAYTNSSYSVYEGQPNASSSYTSSSYTSSSYTTKNTAASMHGYFTNSNNNGHYQNMSSNVGGKATGKYESYSSGPQEEESKGWTSYLPFGKNKEENPKSLLSAGDEKYNFNSNEGNYNNTAITMATQSKPASINMNPYQNTTTTTTSTTSASAFNSLSQKLKKPDGPAPLKLIKPTPPSPVKPAISKPTPTKQTVVSKPTDDLFLIDFGGPSSNAEQVFNLQPVSVAPASELLGIAMQPVQPVQPVQSVQAISSPINSPGPSFNFYQHQPPTSLPYNGLSLSSNPNPIVSPANKQVSLSNQQISLSGSTPGYLSLNNSLGEQPRKKSTTQDFMKQLTDLSLLDEGPKKQINNHKTEAPKIDIWW